MPIPGAPVFAWESQGQRYLLTANLAFAVALIAEDSPTRDLDLLRGAGLTHCPHTDWIWVFAHADPAEIEALSGVIGKMVKSLEEETAGQGSENGQRAGSTWLDVWATARYDYGLPESEVWALTIPEFKALAARADARAEAQDRQTARLMAMLYNINRNSSTPSRSENDFMPQRAKPAVHQVQATWTQIDSVFRALGGR